MSMHVNSKYNFVVPLEEGALLYNSRTGNLLKFDTSNAGQLFSALTGPQHQIEFDQALATVAAELIDGEFLIDSDFDELEEIRRAFMSARSNTPMVVTLTTTMDCNLGCYYCYEDRSGDYLRETDAEVLASTIVRRAVNSNRHSLHVDWYGGEPTLNTEFIEAFSSYVQPICKSRNIRYEASIISNGTEWPADPVAFANRNKLQQIQISLDGMEKNHNKRRRFRATNERQTRSSFEEAVSLIDCLVHHVRVDVRLNLDRRNVSDIPGLIHLFRKKGWFEGPIPIVVQPARLGSYSEKSSFMRDYEFSADEFDKTRKRIRTLVSTDAVVEESESPDGYPSPRRSVCAALASDSFVVGADYQEYRCGLQVGERHRSVGNIYPKNSFRGIPVVVSQRDTKINDNEWWEHFDPTGLDSCSRCSFLPVCWGGCPKKHLEGDKHALAEQGEYWKSNLARLVASNVDSVTPLAHRYSANDQFRDSGRKQGSNRAFNNQIGYRISR